MKTDNWSLTNIPPAKHKDVAEFAAQLFDIARIEKDRLGKPDDFLANYALYRGYDNRRKQSSGYGTRNYGRAAMLVNLFFANIERTISNITAKAPVGEVVDLSGAGEEVTQLMTMRLQKWWKDTNQQVKIRAAARTMEIYGIIPEKPFWNKQTEDVDVLITDPFAFFPAPGYYEDIDTDSPFVCFAYIDMIDKVEKDFNLHAGSIAAESAYDLLGVEREDYKAQGGTSGNHSTIGNYTDRMMVSKGADAKDKKVEQCLIVEVWVRDNRMRKNTEPAILPNQETGEIELVDVQDEFFVYPDHIRKITITKAKDQNKNQSGWIVIDDSPNPNINPELPQEIAEKTHPWGRFPVYFANSYRDLVSIWGFSAAEQTGDLIAVINRILHKITRWVDDALTPPLILPRNIGITREMIESNNDKAGRLIIQPSNYIAAGAIRFLDVPNLPASFYQTLDLLVKFFDRTYQIEDADRGEAPSGVIAAKAIVALQERNQVVMQAKTSSIDNLAENRSRWAIGLWQNFATDPVAVNVGGSPTSFIGTDFAGFKFNYVVEAGSSTPRTNLQVQEMAPDLFKMGLIDQQATLKILNIPGWKEIVERMGQDQLGVAMQTLVSAGMPEEEAQGLYQYLMQVQGGPGNETQNQPQGQQPPKQGAK